MQLTSICLTVAFVEVAIIANVKYDLRPCCGRPSSASSAAISRR